MNPSRNTMWMELNKPGAWPRCRQVSVREPTKHITLVYAAFFCCALNLAHLAR